MEYAEILQRAQKELFRAQCNLKKAKKQNAPKSQIENLEKKLAYKKFVAQMLVISSKNRKFAVICGGNHEKL